MSLHSGTIHGTHPEEFILEKGGLLWFPLLENVPLQVAHAFLLTADKKLRVRVKPDIKDFKFFSGGFTVFRVGLTRLLAVYKSETDWRILTADVSKVQQWVIENPTSMFSKFVRRHYPIGV